MKVTFYQYYIFSKLEVTDFLSKYDKLLGYNYCRLVSLLILICSLSIFNMGLAFASPQNKVDETESLTFCDPIYGVRIQYPANWLLDKKQIMPYDDVTKIVGFIKDPNALTGDFVISVHTLSNQYFNGTIGIEALLNHTRDYYKQYYHDFNLVESTTDVTLGNTSNSAYKLIWTDKDGPYTIKNMQMATIIGNLAYIIRYYADQEHYSNNFPLIERMIDSLRIFNNNAYFVSQNYSVPISSKASC
jgi:hypothetical protein